MFAMSLVAAACVSDCSQDIIDGVRYAPIDGVCNNEKFPLMGGVGALYFRDGSYRALDENQGPGPRNISNALRQSAQTFEKRQRSAQHLSILWAYFGEFITADITHSITNRSGAD